jgi:hypothetical protein
LFFRFKDVPYRCAPRTFHWRWGGGLLWGYMYFNFDFKNYVTKVMS